MRKVACFCDRCAVAADWILSPSRRNFRFFELVVSCHGESEHFLVAASELLHARGNGRESASPLYVIAFEEAQAREGVKVIGPACDNLSIRIKNHTNRLAGE